MQESLDLEEFCWQSQAIVVCMQASSELERVFVANEHSTTMFR
jgi:hypothetical protein